MGKQSATLYFDGRVHSDIGMYDSYKGYQNASKMYIGNQLVWERRPANLLAISGSNFYTSADLTHFSSMGAMEFSELKKKINISITGESATIEVLNGCFVYFYTGAVHGPDNKNETRTILIKSEDGYSWESFYEYIGIVKGIGTSTIYNQNSLVFIAEKEVCFFDNNFSLYTNANIALSSYIYFFQGNKTLFVGTSEKYNDQLFLYEIKDGQVKTIGNKFYPVKSYLDNKSGYCWDMFDNLCFYNANSKGSLLIYVSASSWTEYNFGVEVKITGNVDFLYADEDGFVFAIRFNVGRYIVKIYDGKIISSKKTEASINEKNGIVRCKKTNVKYIKKQNIFNEELESGLSICSKGNTEYINNAIINAEKFAYIPDN